MSAALSCNTLPELEGTSNLCDPQDKRWYLTLEHDAAQACGGDGNV